MKFKITEAFSFVAVYPGLDDIALDNVRGDAAFDTRKVLYPHAERYELRMKQLGKERMAIIKAHSADEKGEIQYKNPNEADESKKLILFRDEAACQAEIDAWQAKVDEFEATEIEATVPLLPKTFFAGLKDVKQRVRNGFKPFMST